MMEEFEKTEIGTNSPIQKVGPFWSKTSSIAKCKICLAIEIEMIDILGTVLQVGEISKTASEIFENITGTPVSEDETPHALCTKCFNSMKEVFTLQVQAKESEENLKTMCRICLSCNSDENRNIDDIFEMEEGKATSVRELFEIGTGLLTTENIGLPNMICKVCISRLVEYIRIREQAQESFNVLEIQNPIEMEEIKTDIEDEMSVDNNLVPVDPPKPKDKKKSKRIKSHICIVCHKKYVTDIQMKRHLREVHTTKKRKYSCRVCPLIFDTGRELKCHMVNHLNEKPNKCHRCPEEFRFRAELQTHIRKDHPDEPFVCNECSQAFDDARDLKRHIRNNHWKHPVICHVCAKSFSSMSKLKPHLLIHSNEKPYACDICSKAYVTADLLKSHIRSHTGERPFACNICPRKFPTASTLRNHKRMHSDDRPYACKLCPMAYKNAVNLQRHIKYHTGERPFPCPECSKAFKDNCTLRSHMLIHSQERPFVCELCSKGFNRKNSLTLHMRIHNNERPFECSICKKGFTVGRDCREHEETHSDERKYLCDMCNKGFKTARYLRHHKKKCLKGIGKPDELNTE